MVKSLPLEKQHGNKRPVADIFRAAAKDDTGELWAALSEGKTLDDVDENTGFTPIIIALISGSETFLESAMQIDFNPWYRDPNERLAIDHANALGMRAIQKKLLRKMYPSAVPTR